MEAREERSRMWDVVMMLLLVGSVALVFLYEALDPLRFEQTRHLLVWIDAGLVVFFVAEWGWRVRQNAPGMRRYAWRNSWELLGMIPLIAPVPAALRSLRLLRVVRILRVFKTVGRRLGLWERIARQGHLKTIGLASAAVTLVGATLVWLLERDEPGTHLPLYSDAIWWAIVTVTTVGYGDITPVSAGGRFIAAGLMIVGIGIIGLLASTLAAAFFEERDEQSRADASGVADQLHTLAHLHQEGHLDDEEFTAAKAKVLQ